PLAPVATATDGAKIQYSTDDGKTWKDEVPSITAVGTLPVKVRATKDGYDPAEVAYTLKVTPKEVIVTANDKSKEFGETDPVFDAKAEGLLGTDTVVYTVERAPGEAVGTYVITPKGADTQGNYTVKYVTGIFTIVKKPAAALNLVAKDAEKVYDGTPLAPVATATDGAKIQYSTDDGKTWKDEVPSITAVGTLPVKVMATKEGYEPAEAAYTLKVTPKPVTVKAEDKSKTKGDADPTLTAKVQGLLGTDKVVYTLKRTPGEVAGTYKIEVSGAAAQGNYVITYVPAIFTIRDKGNNNSIVTTPDDTDSGSSSGSGSGSPGKTETIKDEQPPLGKLNTEDHFAYIQGYPDGSVQPQGLLTREEVAAVFFRLLDKSYREEIRSQSNEFGDVREGMWANKHISTLTKGKIINGYEDGSFRPHNSITRAELAAIASRFDRLEVNATHKFTDLNGHWAEKYIASAVKKGWVNGYEDGTFRPDKYITRAEFVNFVNNVLNRHVKEQDILKDSRVFTDLVDASKWYYTAMKAATNSYLYNDGGTQNKDGVLIKFQKWTKLITPVIEM
ncbi:MAG: MBG domain-containing protein, partial [Bacillota bacterium]|nr:MBG domain-containing protein [Bacillota bacterium]